METKCICLFSATNLIIETTDTHKIVSKAKLIGKDGSFYSFWEWKSGNISSHPN